MAKYKPHSIAQGILTPVHLSHQIQKGTFEYTLSQMVDNVLDLSFLDSRFNNDETGAPAYAPKILLKIVLFAYSRGIISSRKIARACVENMVFRALSADTKPHFTTIANFISSMDKATIRIFRDILMICDQRGLIGKEMFAVDGCKLPSNASKEWSGTRSELAKKAAKMEHAVELLVNRHYKADATGTEQEMKQRDEQYTDTLKKQVDKLKRWLDDNDDKPGKTGKPRKSNVTDNDSAKMKTSKGVIQGYNGVASVDSKHQIVVHAEAFGQGSEHDLLQPMIEGTEENFSAIINRKDIADTRLTADSGFHSEKNMKMLAEKQIDGYVADNQMRKRDPRFADYGRYKERHRKDRTAFEGRSRLFKVADFTFADDLSHCICPAGKRLYANGNNITNGKFKTNKYRGPKSACIPCKMRRQCLRNPDNAAGVRQVSYFLGRTEQGKNTFTEKMKRKIDSAVGKFFYSKRLGTVEPVFANICSTIGLNRFTHRGKKKVNSQWMMYCMVHNLKKIHQFGPEYA
jgi:transposase